jgi:Ion channel
MPDPVGPPFPWRRLSAPAGFIVGLLLILALVAAASLPMIGLPITTPVVWFVFFGAVFLYLVNGFTYSLCLILGVTILAAGWPEVPRAFGYFVYALLLNPTAQPSEALAAGMAILLFILFYGKRGYSIEQGGMMSFFGALFWAGVSLAVFIVEGINARALRMSAPALVVAAFSFAIFYLPARGRADRKFLALWRALQPFDTKFGAYIATRLPAILLVILAYLYIVVTFGGVYYYIDNCDHAEFPCNNVNYSRFLGKPAEGNETCWTFNAITPLAAGEKVPPNLCENHLTTKPFSIDAFLPYLYFSMVTSTTVGYGDIAPLSISAVWIVIVHHLASIILLIAVVTQLASFSASLSDDAYDT